MIIAKIIYSVVDHALIDEDVKAYGCSSFKQAFQECRPFRNFFLYRIAKQSKVLFRIARCFVKAQNDLEINVTSGKLGKGFAIWHGYGTVIYCREIGEYCQINQGVTIGRGKEIDGSDIPVIGNNV